MDDFAAPALLAITLAALFWFQRNSVRHFAEFGAIDDTRRRQRTFLKWAAQGCVVYLGIPLIGLTLIGRLDALWDFPPEFWPVAIELPAIDSEALAPLALGAAIGVAIVVIAVLIRNRVAPRKVKHAAPPKIAPLMPRNRAEALHLVPLILNAGVAEEVFFRVYLPLLLVLAGLNAMIAFAAVTVIFGLLHRYQGWVGIILTGVVGGYFAFAYLASGGLFLPVLLHLLLNSSSLLLRPAVQHFSARRGD